MAKRTIIPTRRSEKGGLVVGHRVYAFIGDDLPAVPGDIVKVSKSGLSVVFDVGPVMAAFGLPRRSRWTWRNKVSSYVPQGERARQGVGLAITPRPAQRRD